MDYLVQEVSGNISLQGFGLSEATVAQFLRNLEASPYYRGVELKVIEQATISGRKLQKFDVTCISETPPKETVKP
jgi:type IV pilus assembly protein PilN